MSEETRRALDKMCDVIKGLCLAVRKGDTQEIVAIFERALAVQNSLHSPMEAKDEIKKKDN